MQFAKVALRRPVGPSWRSLAHWASASLLPPLAALGSHSSQRSRCVGPWGLPGAPLLTGLPPRSSRHWRRSAPTVRKGRAASARGAFLALPCSLGFRLAPPATGGARLCPHGGFHRLWRRKVNCPEGTREGHLGGVRLIRKKPCAPGGTPHGSLPAP